MTAPLWITGLGIAAAGTTGIPAFEAVLRSGRSAIAPVAGPGPLRRAALLPEAAFAPPCPVPRGATRAARSAVTAAAEAWRQAGLTDPSDVALVLAGHNLALAETGETLLAQQHRLSFAPPRHATQVWDSHPLGVVAAALGLAGPGLVAGAHFASGLAALAQASLLLRAGEACAALVVAPCIGLSPLEWHAFANLGALDPSVLDPTVLAPGAGPEAPRYQPFAPGGAGLVPGEAAAALVIETAAHARARGAGPLARLGAVRVVLSGRAGPEPDAATEARAMRMVLAAAGLAPDAIGYVNAHATGTPAGDRAEAEAIRTVFGGGPGAPVVNATKAITGHTLMAAGLVGTVATVLQLRGGFLHANPALDAEDGDAGPGGRDTMLRHRESGLPHFGGLRLAGRATAPLAAEAALCNAFGFDGLHGSALILRAET
ncbi:beta-ketoacyl synthase N-terminal-like domain-containing protein [Methylobacterium aquaticum]|uniref:beta-ketoacyl synthase N-terminal-like domain-containing protein n=1 Tax=Methylobacterium aquaticum TaxID=270351 RepID=UPI003D183E4C